MTLRTILQAEPDPEQAASLDGFLATSPFAAYQQSRIWACVVPRSRVQDYLYFAAFDGERLVGAAVVRRTRLAAGAWLATVQRGPVVHRAGDMAAVLPALVTALRHAGCCSVQLAPRVRGRDLPAMADALRCCGFAPLPPARQSLHGATGIVWLDKPEAEVLAGFKQRARRQFKAADRAGVSVRPVAGANDVAIYQGLLDAFRASRPDYDMGGLPDAAGQERLIDALGGAMLLAELDEVPVGGHAFVRQGDEAIWLSLATTDTLPQVALSYPLLWAAMRTARALGCVGYDLAGVPVGEPEDEGEANRMQFKGAFAPHKRIMPPMQVAAIRPVRHLLLFGARQLYRGSPLRRRVAAWRAGAAHG